MAWTGVGACFFSFLFFVIASIILRREKDKRAMQAQYVMSGNGAPPAVTAHQLGDLLHASVIWLLIGRWDLHDR